MHILKTLLSFVRESVLVGILLGILSVCLVGALISSPNVIVQAGHLQLTAFPTGISLFLQGNGSYYYVISPYTDFVIDDKGTRGPLLFSPKTPTPTSPSPTQDLTNLQDISDTVSSYFGYPESVSLSQSGQYTTHYSASAQGNDVIIKKNITFPAQSQIAEFGNVVQFGKDDFVFDPHTGTLYTQKSPQDIQTFHSLYHIDLHTNDSSDSAIRANSVVIHNPTQPGFLKISANTNQKLQINKQWNFIEVTEPVYGDKTQFSTTLEIKTLETLKNL